MAIIRIKEINAMSVVDRAKKLGELRTELAHIRTMVNAGGAVENPARIRELRRTIAQILTIQNEKKLGIRQAIEEKQEKKTEKTTKTRKVKKVTEEKVSQ